MSFDKINSARTRDTRMCRTIWIHRLIHRLSSWAMCIFVFYWILIVRGDHPIQTCALVPRSYFSGNSFQFFAFCFRWIIAQTAEIHMWPLADFDGSITYSRSAFASRVRRSEYIVALGLVNVTVWVDVCRWFFSFFPLSISWRCVAHCRLSVYSFKRLFSRWKAKIRRKIESIQTIERKAPSIEDDNFVCREMRTKFPRILISNRRKCFRKFSFVSVAKSTWLSSTNYNLLNYSVKCVYSSCCLAGDSRHRFHALNRTLIIWWENGIIVEWMEWMSEWRGSMFEQTQNEWMDFLCYPNPSFGAVEVSESVCGQSVLFD